jgi:DNA repair protein RadC
MNIKLKTEDQIKILCADDIYGIMQRILLRENKIERDREHLWTISLDAVSKILNIELVSMGSITKTVVEPMEVYSVPLQKRAVKIVIIHNHPSGELKPSAADKDMTEILIQCGLILHVPVLDHRENLVQLC